MECHELILLWPDCLCAAMLSWKEDFHTEAHSSGARPTIPVAFQDFLYQIVLCWVLWSSHLITVWFALLNFEKLAGVILTAILYSCTSIDKMNGRPSWSWCHGPFRCCWQISRLLPIPCFLVLNLPICCIKSGNGTLGTVCSCRFVLWAR